MIPNHTIICPPIRERSTMPNLRALSKKNIGTAPKTQLPHPTSISLSFLLVSIRPDAVFAQSRVRSCCRLVDAVNQLSKKPGFQTSLPQPPSLRSCIPACLSLSSTDGITPWRTASSTCMPPLSDLRNPVSTAEPASPSPPPRTP